MISDKSNLKKFLLCLLILVALGGALRFAFFNTLKNHPVSFLDFYFRDSDMAGNLSWTYTILQGDKLGKKTYHPYHQWMKDIAPLNQWFEWWKSPFIFQQSPLYPYFLYGLIKVTSGNTFSVRWTQHLIGLGSGLLIFLSLTLFFPLSISFFGGLLAILYFPTLCFEFFFLRDYLSLHCLSWFLFVFFLSVKKQSLKWAPLLGLICGISILARENFLILLLPFPIFALSQKQFSMKKRIVWLGFFLFCTLISISPLFYRNIQVGAPLFSFSNRLLEAIIEGLAYDSTPIYMCIPESMKMLLKEGQGDIFTTLKLVLAGYPNGVLGLSYRLLEKSFFLLFILEPYNNINLYYFSREFPLLRFLPNFSALILLTIPGIIFSLKEKKYRPWFWLFILFFLSLLIGPILARYRLVFVPFLIFFSSLTLFKMQKIFEISFLPLLLGCIIFCLGIQILLENSLPKKYTHRQVEYQAVEDIQKIDAKEKEKRQLLLWKQNL